MLLCMLTVVALSLDSTTYSGRDGQTVVAPPRLDGPVEIDGVLNEPQWAQSARLTGFSQYSPSDGRPAEDSTEVMVWYRAVATSANRFRGDAMVSYQPRPGTVFFVGYGSTSLEPEALRFSRLRRTSDGFFVKGSYLFRW